MSEHVRPWRTAVGASPGRAEDRRDFDAGLVIAAELAVPVPNRGVSGER